MKDVQEPLDRLVPEPATIADWEAVLRDARPRKRSLILQLGVATGVAALAALFVVAPWKGSERVGILDKALAAVGDEPVLHVVFRGDWGGTLVDLKTDERKSLYGERELWYDPDRGVVHQISRFADVVDHDVVYGQKKGDRELTALWQDYRRGLENGTARVVGQDTVNHVPVYWLIVHSQMLPDVADNKNHELAQQVAISRETFKPVAMKYTRDRRSLEGSIEHILLFETVPFDEEDFKSRSDASLNGRAMMSGSTPARFESAAEILGRTPYWLGPHYSGLPLVQTRKEIFAIAQSPEVLVTGPRAEELRKCVRSRAARRACNGHVQVRDGSVYEIKKPQFGPEHTGVTFFYGTLGDDPSTFKNDTTPLWTEPHVVITQTTDRELPMRAPTKYVPPGGSIVLMAGVLGYLVRGSVYIRIQAASDEKILDAARALRPLSAGSAAGG